MTMIVFMLLGGALFIVGMVDNDPYPLLIGMGLAGMATMLTGGAVPKHDGECPCPSCRAPQRPSALEEYESWERALVVEFMADDLNILELENELDRYIKIAVRRSAKENK